MTDEYYRAINRAIALVEDQDAREYARTALHHIFGREKLARLREELRNSTASPKELADYAPDLLDELDGLREELQRQAEGFKENLRKGTEEVRAQRDTLLASLREIAGWACEEDGEVLVLQRHARAAIAEYEGGEVIFGREKNLQARLTVCNEERREQDRELTRLREENEHLNARLKYADTQGKRIEMVQDQHAALLAALKRRLLAVLREIANADHRRLGWAQESEDIARAAIAEYEENADDPL